VGPELKGRIVVLSEMRDTMGILMMANGVDISGDWGSDEFNEALDILARDGRSLDRFETSAVTLTPRT
jgi:hypothetical protein